MNWCTWSEMLGVSVVQGVFLFVVCADACGKGVVLSVLEILVVWGEMCV